MWWCRPRYPGKWRGKVGKVCLGDSLCGSPLTRAEGFLYLVTWDFFLEGWASDRIVWSSCFLPLNVWILTVLGLQDLEHHPILSLFISICGVANLKHNYKKLLRLVVYACSPHDLGGSGRRSMSCTSLGWTGWSCFEKEKKKFWPGIGGIHL